MQARVIVLVGPSGSGTSRLAERLGLPVLRLDDFYLDGDPTLPRIDLGGGDHRRLGRPAVVEPRRGGRRRRGAVRHRVHDLGGAAYFVAEGIFAHEVVGDCRSRGLLADAVCVTQHPALT